jgi:hypothetical protein
LCRIAGVGAGTGCAAATCVGGIGAYAGAGATAAAGTGMPPRSTGAGATCAGAIGAADVVAGPAARWVASALSLGLHAASVSAAAAALKALNTVNVKGWETMGFIAGPRAVGRRRELSAWLDDAARASAALPDACLSGCEGSPTRVVGTSRRRPRPRTARLSSSRHGLGINWRSPRAACRFAPTARRWDGR